MPESEIIYRLVIAFLIGGAIGFEREYLSKAAGFRTLILISVGSCLFTIFSILIAHQTPDRIASNIVTGIGFLGAGVIFKEDNRVKGLTTAASIWVTAALGMGIGGGYYVICVAGAGVSLIALFLLVKLENLIETVNQSRNYKIGCAYKHETLAKFEDMFRAHRLKFKRNKQTKNGENITGTWIVNGSEKNHNAFIKEILNDDSVIEFEF
ncbi:MAG TPA: MgtC/SapB family protein [Chitinophagaceae bacterium]|nr:MgtC/SapB family protein [Chitinophagaceae bacterium]